MAGMAVVVDFKFYLILIKNGSNKNTSTFVKGLFIVLVGLHST